MGAYDVRPVREACPTVARRQDVPPTRSLDRGGPLAPPEAPPRRAIAPRAGRPSRSTSGPDVGRGVDGRLQADKGAEAVTDERGPPQPRASQGGRAARTASRSEPSIGGSSPNPARESVWQR